VKTVKICLVEKISIYRCIHEMSPLADPILVYPVIAGMEDRSPRR